MVGQRLFRDTGPVRTALVGAFSGASEPPGSRTTRQGSAAPSRTRRRNARKSELAQSVHLGASVQHEREGTVTPESFQLCLEVCSLATPLGLAGPLFVGDPTASTHTRTSLSRAEVGLGRLRLSLCWLYNPPTWMFLQLLHLKHLSGPSKMPTLKRQGHIAAETAAPRPTQATSSKRGKPRVPACIEVFPGRTFVKRSVARQSKALKLACNLGGSLSAGAPHQLQSAAKGLLNCNVKEFGDCEGAY